MANGLRAGRLQQLQTTRRQQDAGCGQADAARDHKAVRVSQAKCVRDLPGQRNGRTALAASHARHNRDAWMCRSQPRSGARVDNWVTWWLQLKVSENGRLKTRAEEECGNKPRCGLYSPIHVDMDMGVRVVKRPLYTAHVGAGAFLWKTGKRHGKWRFHNVSTG